MAAVTAVERLLNLLNEEMESLNKFKSEVGELRDKLLKLQPLLENAVAGQETNDSLRQDLAKLRIFSCKMEDVIEGYIFQVQTFSWRRFIVDIHKQYSSIFTGAIALPHPVAAEITETNTWMSSLAENLQALQLPERSYLASGKLQRLMEGDPRPDEEVLVGMERDVDILVSRILKGSDRVIAIVGRGGVGKTALVEIVYNNSDVRDDYDAFAWVHVTRYFQTRTIVERILLQLLHQKERAEIMELSDVELLQQLYKIQQEKRCLIVLDNIWSIEVWKSLRIAFPLGETASKILLTTRLKKVAEAAAGLKHDMKPLTMREATKLFLEATKQRRTAGSMKVDPWIEKRMVSLVKSCGGFPLAVIVLGRLLAAKLTTGEWEEVYENIFSILNRDKGFGIIQLSRLSYITLPSWLRTCFLYLGHFPMDSDIQVEKLCLLWMAEGMTEPREPAEEASERLVMDVVERYLNELAQRIMIRLEREKVPIHGRFKSCSVQGWMRNLCLAAGKEEEFLEVIYFQSGNRLLSDTSSPSNFSTRNLAIHIDEDRYLHSIALKRAWRVRSILFFNVSQSWKELAWPMEMLGDLGELRLLRVLDFNGFDFREGRLPRGLGKLIRLRYLSFKGCHLEELPSSIGNLGYLQILDLRVIGTVDIPNILWKLKRLKHLYLPAVQSHAHSHKADKLQLDGLINLEIVENFDPSFCYMKEPSKLFRLQKLAANAEGNTIKELLDMIQGVTEAAQLSLDIRNFDCYSEERCSLITRLFWCRNVHTLHIEGRLAELPESYQDLYRRIVEISFSGSGLADDPMTTLEKLPNLRSLCLFDDAFEGELMVCSAAGFPQLRSLKLWTLRNLRRWTVENGAMPNLFRLEIHKCPRLGMRPKELEYFANVDQKITDTPNFSRIRMRIVNVRRKCKLNTKILRDKNL